ncbi:MAG: hypothetical protein WAO74_09700 [Polaribacter sp.]|uniref:hypothetical protein n=1 Tax=Polaribacter sp. TaxID=1920175 RepID=UPI003BAE54C3
MEKSDFIKQQVDDTFKVLDSFDVVKVNSFFKHKVLQKINAEKELEEKSIVFGWFTPKLQLATLGLVLLLNASSIFYVFLSQEKNTEVTIETFAKSYSLQTETNYILN